MAIRPYFFLCKLGTSNLQPTSYCYYSSLITCYSNSYTPNALCYLFFLFTDEYTFVGNPQSSINPLAKS